LVAALASIIFFRVSEDITGVRNRNGILFFSDLTIGAIAMQYTSLLFPKERPIFLRERGNHMYDVGPYFLGKVFAELPLSILQPIVFGSIIYPSVGLDLKIWWKFPAYRKRNTPFIYYF
jgi:hypothetical protein